MLLGKARARSARDEAIKIDAFWQLRFWIAHRNQRVRRIGPLATQKRSSTTTGRTVENGETLLPSI